MITLNLSLNILFHSDYSQRDYVNEHLFRYSYDFAKATLTVIYV